MCLAFLCTAQNKWQHCTRALDGMPFEIYHAIHAHCFFVENSMSCVKGKTNKAASSKWGVIFFMYSNHISYKGHANLQWIIHHIFIEFSLILLYKIIYIFFSSKNISERGIGNGIDNYYFLCLGVLVSISLFNFTIL